MALAWGISEPHREAHSHQAWAGVVGPPEGGGVVPRGGADPLPSPENAVSDLGAAGPSSRSSLITEPDLSAPGRSQKGARVRYPQWGAPPVLPFQPQPLLAFNPQALL